MYHSKELLILPFSSLWEGIAYESVNTEGIGEYWMGMERVRQGRGSGVNTCWEKGIWRGREDMELVFVWGGGDMKSLLVGGRVVWSGYFKGEAQDIEWVLLWEGGNQMGTSRMLGYGVSTFRGDGVWSGYLKGVGVWSEYM